MKNVLVRAARSGLVWSAVLGAGLAGLAAINRQQARRAERRHPPRGRFVEIDGVALHYLEKGEGSPVVLIHGNALEASDFQASGLFDLLAMRHRVIAIDRPGYGYSKRPGHLLWTAAEQAVLLQGAVRALAAEGAVVIGHSFGASIALEMALRYPRTVKSLILAGGYFFPSPRVDSLLCLPQVLPGIGALLRNTVMPVALRLSRPLLSKTLFSPRAAPPKFAACVPPEMGSRPSQIRAVAGDSVALLPSSMGLARRLGRVTQPVTIVCGENDLVVRPRQSIRLHRAIPHSELRVVPYAGHMVHYVAARKIAAIVDTYADAAASRLTRVQSGR